MHLIYITTSPSQTGWKQKTFRTVQHCIVLLSTRSHYLQGVKKSRLKEYEELPTSFIVMAVHCKTSSCLVLLLQSISTVHLYASTKLQTRSCNLSDTNGSHWAVVAIHRYTKSALFPPACRNLPKIFLLTPYVVYPQGNPDSMNPEEESTDSVYACPARQLWNGKRDHRNGAQGKQNSPFQKEKKKHLKPSGNNRQCTLTSYPPPSSSATWLPFLAGHNG